MDENVKDWDLKPFHAEILNVFRAFEKICQGHGLRYYAIGGTAIGAVRHHGFIPWDDDLDVAMPREDYDIFRTVVKNELPANMRFCRGGEDVYSPIYFGKIIDTRESVISEIRAKTNLDIKFPPFIDIFVLEGVPDSVPEIKKWWRGRRLLRLCQVYRYPKSVMASGERGQGLRKFLAVCLGFFVSLFYPKTNSNEEMMELLDAFSRRWSYESSEMVVEPAFFKFKFSRVFRKDVFGSGRRVAFEDGTICVPARVEEYLKAFFGDYMTPPPKEFRIPEHTFKRAYNHV